MSLLNQVSDHESLLKQTNDLINQPQVAQVIRQNGAAKKRTLKKKVVKKPKSKTVKKTKTVKKSTKSKRVKKVKKVKEMDKYTKIQLERIAKRNNITRYRKDGTRKTKEQLFKTLKRKNLL